MGNLISRELRCPDPDTADGLEFEAGPGPSHTHGSGKRKQKRRDCLGSSSSQDPRNTNPRKKVKMTSKRTYETLFLSGENSDIKICALGKVWHLHKAYLRKSGYFATLFKGIWKELCNDAIELDVTDENVDVQSLHFVLGSLYRDERMVIKPLRVIRILATARLLDVEDLILQCNETMKKATNVKTVCAYYTAAETYGLYSVKTGCLEYLLHNLMTHPSVDLYKEISIELMFSLVSSSNLLVMQKEIDIYTTLKEWVFLHLNPCWKGSMKQLLAHANRCFSNLMEGTDNITFLEKEEGIMFQPVFKQLRLQYIIYDLASTTVIEQDRIIPSEWLTTIYKQQWLTLLELQQHREIGPQVINEEELGRYSMRCGKRIIKDGRYSWRWSGCNFGFPLHVIFTNRYIIFKQNNQRFDGSTYFQRNVVFRITLVYFDSSGKLTFEKTTGYKILTFVSDEDQIVMKLDDIVLNFPLYIFCNFLFVSSENTGN